jgi:hypothetical protein
MGDFILFMDPEFPSNLSTTNFSAGGGFRSVTAAMFFTLGSCISEPARKTMQQCSVKTQVVRIIR